MNHDYPEQTPDQQRRGDLMYCQDLGEAIGIVVGQPPPHLDEHGSVVWGSWQRRGTNSETRDVYDELEFHIAAAVEAESRSLDPLPPLDRTVATQSYDHPPAAKSIPEIAAILWENGRPIIESGGLVLEAARIIRGTLNRIVEWYRRKNEEIEKLHQAYYSEPQTAPHDYVDAGIPLTHGAIITFLLLNLLGV